MDLKHIDGKVVVAVDREGKNWHKFSDGTVIRLERQYDNFNRRETEPVNGLVISAENIPRGSEVLIHPNAATDTNQITNYRQLSGQETGSDIKYYSIPEDQCFIWKDESGKWKPLPPYETALRVFRPYKGMMIGIEPTPLKDTLYCTSGELKGKVLATIKSSDYEIVFQNSDGREGRIIRWRPMGDEKTNREPEAVAVMNNFTDQVNEGELWVGLSTSDAKPLNELIHG